MQVEDRSKPKYEEAESARLCSAELCYARRTVVGYRYTDLEEQRPRIPPAILFLVFERR